MKAATNATLLLDSLRIPEGPKAGQAVKLPLYLEQFVLADLATAIRGAA